MQEEEIEQEAYTMQTVYQNDLEHNEQEQNDKPKEDIPSKDKYRAFDQAEFFNYLQSDNGFIHIKMDRAEPKVLEPALRLMMQEERTRAFNLMMLESQCAFCKTQVYCAEMTCDCPWTEHIEGTLEEAWYKKLTYCHNKTDIYSEFHQLKMEEEEAMPEDIEYDQF